MTKNETIEKIAKKWGWTVEELMETLENGGSSMNPVMAISAGQTAHAIIKELMKPVKWFNGCDRTVPEALRFLAHNERPTGGEQHFNMIHLEQLAEEIEIMVKRTS